MTHKLQSIFESITPDNIKDIPVIKDAMGIFIETLEELSSESIDIKNIVNNENIREELIKIYLDDLYNVLQQIQVNQKIIDKVNSINKIYNAFRDPDEEQYEYINTDIITNISKYITDEHFMAFRTYKEKKGTKLALSYMYSLISSFVNSGESDGIDFSIKETGKPFDLEIEGPLPAEFYEYIIYPLAHPLGFTYTYSRYINLLLQDYFPEEQFVYTVNKLEVRSLAINGTTTTFDYSDRNVTSIANIVVDTVKVKQIIFDNGEYLEQQTTQGGQITVYLKNDTETLITFPDQSSIYFDYNFDIETTVKDDISLVEIESVSEDDADMENTVTEEFEMSSEASQEMTESQEYALTGDQYLTIGGSYEGEDLLIGGPWINPNIWERINSEYDGYPILIGDDVYISTYHLIRIEQPGDVYFDYTNFEGMSYFSDDFTGGVYRDDVLLEDNNISAIS